MAAFMELSMTGCNMRQSNTVTAAEETNADNTAARAGQQIQGLSSKRQPHPSGWIQMQLQIASRSMP